MKISHYKARRVAAKLAEKFNTQQKELKKQITGVFENALKAKTPALILKCFEKYPRSINTVGGFCAGNMGVFVYPNTPCFDSWEKVVSKTKPEVAEFCEQYTKGESQMNEFVKKTTCVLESLGTYKRIKMEFPEAYAVLCELDNLPSENNMCDSVENLRAQLK